MKGFLACVLSSVPLFTARKLKQPIHIIVSYDEEVGCTGVRPLIARLGKDLPRPRAIIVGEPTNMTVIEAHKRIDAYRTTVTGKEAHSSLPQLGVNAISVAAELIEEIDRIGAALVASERNDRFDPPSSTVQVGTIEGGTAPNIVPKTCKFQWQVRSLPDADADFAPKRLKAFAEERLLPRMKRVADTASIETQHLGERACVSRRAWIRGGCSGAGAHRRQQRERRVLCDRGRPVRGGWLLDGDLRPRRHRAGPCRR